MEKNYKKEAADLIHLYTQNNVVSGFGQGNDPRWALFLFCFPLLQCTSPNSNGGPIFPDVSVQICQILGGGIELEGAVPHPTCMIRGWFALESC